MKTKTKKLAALLLIFSILLPNIALARKVRRVALTPVQTASVPTAHAEEQVQPVNCEFTLPEDPVYQAEFIAVRRKAFVAEKEAFEVKVFIQNTGNTTWFSADSGCMDAPTINLGTDKERDRTSPFYTKNLFWESNWMGTNRVQMESKRVDPEGIATFTFWNQAPEKIGLYREFYTPVAEGISWMDGGMFSTDVKVGEPDITPEKRELLSYIQQSANLADIDLSGEKHIEVDLSEQKMLLKIGDYTISEFRVSTGKARTPTPVGVTHIMEKQEVRVAAKSPHYIMPKWMMFRKGGYGIHALPSLANDSGVFWREALTNIGIPVSHGCIRLLPKDAEFAYSFAEVGTKIEVHR